MLQITNLKKTFYPGTVNERLAMDHLNLSVQDGEFVTIIGSNGAGKSTLFNLIAGSILPDAGKIVLDGEDITFWPEHRRAKQIGRIFQDPMRGTAPSMTIEENLALAYLRSRQGHFGIGIPKREREFFREQLASLGLGLEGRMKTPVGLLSGGQRQAVSLLMCTMTPPKLLLLDEHTAALDPATADKVLQITQEIVQKHRITTLMITHNLQLSLRMGSRTLMMNEGKILLDLCGEQRERMGVAELLERFQQAGNCALDNDRILLQPESFGD